MYRLRFIGDPVLRRETEPITTFDKKLQKTVDEMIKTMHQEEGIGLAAPQVGISSKLLVVDISSLDEDEQPRAFINPVITNTSGESVVEEGCLSIPDVREDVTRPEEIEVEYQDEKGRKCKETFEGWMARVLLHEIDHINGVLFIDHISPLKRQLLFEKQLIPKNY